MTTDPEEFQRKALELDRQGIFLGSPADSFKAGKYIFEQLVQRGLEPEMNIADVGCGALRVGWWLIKYLDPNKYFGIEPRSDVLECAIEELLGEELVTTKFPHFDTNDQFDLSVFKVQFDFVLVWSVFSHASKSQIKKCLDSFVATRRPNGTLVANYFPNTALNDYLGTEWVGRSHESDSPGRTAHDPRWLKNTVEQRGLKIVEESGWGNTSKRLVVIR